MYRRSGFVDCFSACTIGGFELGLEQAVGRVEEGLRAPLAIDFSRSPVTCIVGGG